MRLLLQKYLEELIARPELNQSHIRQALQLLETNNIYTRSEGQPHHFCSFIVPIHRESQSVFIGHHKKANDWIPPGGHIEPNEDPIETVIRESEEELQYKPDRDQIQLFDFSIIPIIPPRSECHTHYDFWFAVLMPEQVAFAYDTNEFYNAGWFTFKVARQKLSRYRHYYQDTISRLNTV